MGYVALWNAEIPARSDRWSTLDNYLVCWVSEQLVAIVDAGVRVNPEECLHWVDEMETPFARALKQSMPSP